MQVENGGTIYQSIYQYGYLKSVSQADATIHIYVVATKKVNKRFYIHANINWRFIEFIIKSKNTINT